MGLTVVTHTNKGLGRDITRCVDSVKAALVPGCKHEIIECSDVYTEFIKARYDAMKLDDYIVFVDDDDYIPPNILSTVLEALIESDAGIVFTNEVKVYEDGREIPSHNTKYYSIIGAAPGMVHHLTAFNSKFVTQRSLDLSLKTECNIEWIMKCDAAANGGAIHIPQIGYYWCMHPGQHHRDITMQHNHTSNLRTIQKELLSWNKRSKDAEIPEWNIT